MLLRARQTIVFEGDSLTSRRTPTGDTWPFLRLANWHHDYPDLVGEWLFCNLPHLNVKVRSAAVGGSSIDDLHDRYDRAVAPLNPDLLVLTIGNNDPHRGPLDHFERRFDAYLDRLPCPVLYVGNFEPCPGADDTVVERGAASKPYNAAAAERVVSRGGHFLDVGPKLRAKAEALYAQSSYHKIYAEGRHFNAVGSSVLAGLVLAALGAFEAYAAGEG